ncbi:unnamed protein product [Vitrella brassicaformis CCMP3155]|uniref:Uncharacterized protein n=2 Tax=Vitrella brassicaformis TaxID=1169539 RepID=A0A0G4GGD1_VITBC|nr:unnamed protein product [Vitrella brassicaformis CCMP3155]|eukprot:CEM28679.1 unnamed protein product [Vitrella brassicaformis CCMP3155]
MVFMQTDQLAVVSEEKKFHPLTAPLPRPLLKVPSREAAAAREEPGSVEDKKQQTQVPFPFSSYPPYASIAPSVCSGHSEELEKLRRLAEVQESQLNALRHTLRRREAEISSMYDSHRAAREDTSETQTQQDKRQTPPAATTVDEDTQKQIDSMQHEIDKRDRIISFLHKDMQELRSANETLSQEMHAARPAARDAGAKEDNGRQDGTVPSLVVVNNPQNPATQWVVVDGVNIDVDLKDDTSRVTFLLGHLHQAIDKFCRSQTLIHQLEAATATKDNELAATRKAIRELEAQVESARKQLEDERLERTLVDRELLEARKRLTESDNVAYNRTRELKLELERERRGQVQELESLYAAKREEADRERAARADIASGLEQAQLQVSDLSSSLQLERAKVKSLEEQIGRLQYWAAHNRQVLAFAGFEETESALRHQLRSTMAECETLRDQLQNSRRSPMSPVSVCSSPMPAAASPSSSDALHRPSPSHALSLASPYRAHETHRPIPSLATHGAPFLYRTAPPTASARDIKAWRAELSTSAEPPTFREGQRAMDY